MTSTRFKSRSRFLIGCGILILMIGFIAIFNSQNYQIDESRSLRLRCLQEQEALNIRLQAIVDHKFELEKSLEDERLKQKEIKDEQNRKNSESNNRLDSLQQHYKLLESEHQDVVENCAKNKENQIKQVNDLERKVKSLQSQMQSIKSAQTKEIAEWKLKLENLKDENKNFEMQLKTLKTSNQCAHLEKQLNEYKSNCNYNPQNKMFRQQPLVPPQHNHRIDESPSSSSTKSTNLLQPPPGKSVSFNKQELVSSNVYKFNIESPQDNNKLNNNIKPSSLVLGNKLNNTNNININNVKQEEPILKSHLNGGIINSVENFQIAPKPIMANDDGAGFQQAPPINSPAKASTSSSKNDFNLMSVASIASPPSNKIKSSTINNFKESGFVRPKQLPNGVAPLLDAQLLKDRDIEDSKNEINKSMPLDDNKSKDGNNRYANVVNELSNNAGTDDKKDVDEENANAAHEVKDADENLMIDDGAKDHLQDVLDNLNNAAEDDGVQNNFFDSKLTKNDHQEETIDVIGAPAVHRFKKQPNDEDDVALIDNGDNKLINEVVGDQGKESFPDGMHMNEEPEEDEDEDDYPNLAARQQEGIAIRN